MTTPYNQLRQLLTDRLPHLKELSFGCEVFREGSTKRELFVGSFGDEMSLVKVDNNGTWLPFDIPKPPESQEFTIIGHPPTLQDILLAISVEEYRNGVISIETDNNKKYDVEEYYVCSKVGKLLNIYDLTKPLADQTDEVLLDLIKILE